ncbi:MAG: CCA tRNA nucleotidyltransferase, partial [Deltaproteobacteria bacterium]|nr:CCA tRNA nucleotidyltransferase [Deltaproteobacteria bacterium]
FGHSTIDFSSARRETYAGPAVAPKVSAGDLASDLRRRDFSVNALAIEASPGSFGSLLDQVDGAADLANRTLRTLHDASFVDDPARLIRGVRFERRLNFRFNAVTAAFFADAVDRKLCSLLSPRRLFDELRKLAREQDALEMLRRLDELGLLRQILPHANPAAAIVARGEMNVLASLYAAIDEGALLEDFQRFNLSGVERAAIVQAHAELREAP